MRLSGSSKSLWILTAAALVLAAAVFYTKDSALRKTGARMDLETGPAFELPSVSNPGKTVRLESWTKKGPVLLVFWAEWCPPCLQEIPTLRQWQQKHHQEFSILAVHVGESRQPMEAVIAENGINYEVVLDQTSAAASAYGVSGLPAAVMLDKDRKILYYGFTLPSLEDALKYAH
ncbi:MAG: TlpA family protein disulfide reductase [Candidatus Omnitrophica bacterium]|nr:TlpA family protein disulfide reductase [Candidatus Omnitrophota bacterium]